MSNIWLIVAREFNERVRKKSFIVTTLLMPVLMLGLMLAPALMMRYASGQTKTIVVIDRSGLVARISKAATRCASKRRTCRSIRRCA